MVTFAMIMAMTQTAKSQTTNDLKSWEKVIYAISQVESGGNPKAHNPNGDCAGLLQIMPCLVKECNRILKTQGSEKRFTMKDRYNPDKSKEMFVIMQNQYNKEHNTEKAIKCWNSGFSKGWQKRSIRYYNKVMSYMK